MRTFTATQLNKSPQEIFRAVDQDGAVEIKHDRYADSFVIGKKQESVIHDGKLFVFGESTIEVNDFPFDRVKP